MIEDFGHNRPPLVYCEGRDWYPPLLLYQTFEPFHCFGFWHINCMVKSYHTYQLWFQPQLAAVFSVADRHIYQVAGEENPALSNLMTHVFSQDSVEIKTELKDYWMLELGSSSAQKPDSSEVKCCSVACVRWQLFANTWMCGCQFGWRVMHASFNEVDTFLAKKICCFIYNMFM